MESFPNRYLKISHDYPPRPRFGQGIQAALVASGLAQRGHPVYVATGPAVDPDYRPRAGVDEVRPAPDGLAELATNVEQRLFWNLEVNRRLLNLVLESGMEPSVIFNHGYESAPLACYLKERWGTPLVSTAHVVDDLFDEAQGSSRPRGHDRYVQKALEADGFARCDWLVAPNEYIASRLRDIYPHTSERIVVIPHPRSCRILAKRSYRRGETFRAVYVGRLISYKGIRPMLEAIEMASREIDLQVTIIGDGPERARVRAAKEAHGNIEWVSYMSHDRLMEVYRNFDAALLPSTLETHSMVLHEAMQSGLPIVAADVEPTRSLIANGSEAMLVPTSVTDGGVMASSGALAGAIVQLASDESLREEIGRAGFRRAGRLPSAYDYAERLDRIVGQ